MPDPGARIATLGGEPAEPSAAAPPRLPPPAHDAALPPARELPSGVRVRSAIPYADLPGIRPLELDLWLPPGDDRAVPVVVFLHGGGWRLGSRRSAGPAFAAAAVSPFEQVARAGVAVASIDYRLTGEAQWPMQLHDAKAAVRWLRARAGDLGIDADRIAAWGESAGGHLAELLGLTVGDPALEGSVGVTGPSSEVSAVTAWYAPSDLAAVAGDLEVDPMDPTTRESLLLGAAPAAIPDIAAAASPVTHVSGSVPPLLLLHGRADRLVPAVQSERLDAAIRALGGDVELHLYDGADHMWLGTPEVADDALRRTIEFLQRQLSVAPATDQGEPS